MNCSKVIVSIPWSVEGVWTGKYAKWFEDCVRSQAGSATSTDPQVTWTIWNKEFENWKAVSDWVYFGTVDPIANVNCYNIPLLSTFFAGENEQEDLARLTPEAGFLRMAFKTLFDYFHTMESKHIKSGDIHLF